MKQMQFEASLKGEVVCLVDIGGYPHLCHRYFHFPRSHCPLPLANVRFILQHSGLVFVLFSLPIFESWLVLYQGHQTNFRQFRRSKDMMLFQFEWPAWKYVECHVHACEECP
jgi:hypothetical protein